MATIHLHQNTTVTPGQFLAGLTDFGPGRYKLLPTATTGTSRCTIRVPARALANTAKAIEARTCQVTAGNPDHVARHRTRS